MDEGIALPGVMLNFAIAQAMHKKIDILL